MLTLFHCNTSYASQKVRIYLAEKKLPWQSVHIDLRKQEQISSNYRQINPNGTVPSLKDEKGLIHYGSTEIMEFLEETYPKPKLLPSSQEQRKLIHQLCKEHELLHDPHIRTMSYYKIFMSPEKRSQIDIMRVLELAKHHPNAKRGSFLAKAVQGKFTKAEIASAQKAIIEALDLLEKHLKSNGKYVIGTQYSIADAVCTATIFRIKKIGLDEEINNYPHILSWYKIMRQRKSFDLAKLE